VALPPVPKAIASVCWAVPPVRSDVEACMGGRGSVRLDRAVPSVLESGQAVAPGWYRPHYRLSLESVGGSALSTPNWFV
jgi:hypothetical protein